MKIFVNIQSLRTKNLEGFGNYSFEILSRITKNHPEHEFIFVGDRKECKQFKFADNIRFLIIGPPSKHPIIWFFRFEIFIPLILKFFKPDIFISPDGWTPAGNSYKKLSVIHDLNFEHHPEALNFFYRKYYKKYFPIWAKRAKRIITVSNFSAADINTIYNIPISKIDVIYNAANNIYQPLNEHNIKNIREKYTQGNPYFISIGAMIPRKNLSNLFKAFNLFKQQSNSNMKLVIVGAKRWWNEEAESLYENLTFKNDIIFTGWLDKKELANILAASLALTYVSYFEGFGIPIVEAMNCDVPVITSNVTSMPEIAGDAALLVDPFSPQSIADAMQQIYKDEKLRTTLIEKGRNRRQIFNWDKTAELFWQSIEKTINS